MAGTFSPFGLRYDRSLSTSNNSTDGFREYELDPTYSGYAGDLACTFVGMLSAINNGILNPVYDGVAKEQRTSKYIYPCPAMLPTSSNTDPVQAFTAQGFPPLLGVFASFEYYPLALNGQLFKGAYYEQNTPLMPGTKVIAKIICDPNGNYNVQYKSSTQYPYGLGQNNLFSGGWLYNDSGYYKQLTFQGATDDVTAQVWFPKGNQNGSTSYFLLGSGGIGNTDTAGQTPPVINPEDPRTVEGTKGWTNNYDLLVTGLAKEDNNQWSDPTANILAPNNIVQVKFLLSFAQMFADTCSN